MDSPWPSQTSEGTYCRHKITRFNGFRGSSQECMVLPYIHGVPAHLHTNSRIQYVHEHGQRIMSPLLGGSPPGVSNGNPHDKDQMKLIPATCKPWLAKRYAGYNTCKYVYMYVNVCLYVCMYVNICLYVYMYVNICLYVYMYVNICLYVYMYVNICLYVYMYVNICLYVYMYVNICLYLYMYVNICPYLYMYVNICMYVCMYVCMYACMYYMYNYIQHQHT